MTVCFCRLGTSEPLRDSTPVSAPSIRSISFIRALSSNLTRMFCQLSSNLEVRFAKLLHNCHLNVTLARHNIAVSIGLAEHGSEPKRLDPCAAWQAHGCTCAAVRIRALATQHAQSTRFCPYCRCRCHYGVTSKKSPQGGTAFRGSQCCNQRTQATRASR